MDMFNTLNQQQQPYIQSGYGAMGRLNTLLGINPRPQPTAANSPGVVGPQGIDTSGMGPMEKMFAQVLARQQAQQQPQGNAYMPTAGGGVQPIMTNGPAANMGGNSRLAQLLALRAANGDSSAEQIMRAIARSG